MNSMTQKDNYNLHYDDVQGNVLQPPHGTMAQQLHPLRARKIAGLVSLSLFMTCVSLKTHVNKEVTQNSAYFNPSSSNHTSC